MYAHKVCSHIKVYKHTHRPVYWPPCWFSKSQCRGQQRWRFWRWCWSHCRWHTRELSATGRRWRTQTSRTAPPVTYGSARTECLHTQTSLDFTYTGKCLHTQTSLEFTYTGKCLHTQTSLDFTYTGECAHTNVFGVYLHWRMHTQTCAHNVCTHKHLWILPTLELSFILMLLDVTTFMKGKVVINLKTSSITVITFKVYIYRIMCYEWQTPEMLLTVYSTNATSPQKRGKNKRIM